MMVTAEATGQGAKADVADLSDQLLASTSVLLLLGGGGVVRRCSGKGQRKKLFFDGGDKGARLFAALQTADSVPVMHYRWRMGNLLLPYPLSAFRWKDVLAIVREWLEVWCHPATFMIY